MRWNRSWPSAVSNLRFVDEWFRYAAYLVYRRHHANEEKCRKDVHNSIGVVTALNPVIGYKNSTKIAKEAQETGKGVL